MNEPTYQQLLDRVDELEQQLLERDEPAPDRKKEGFSAPPGESAEQLLNQLRFIKTLFDTIPSPLFYKNRDGIYLGCNQAFASLILGIQPEEIIGKSLSDFDRLIPRELADYYQQQDRALFEEPGLQVYEAKVKCADGSLRDFVFYKTTYLDHHGDVAGLIGLMLDVSEKNRFQLMLQESEEKYRSMMESMNDAVYICSPDFRITYMNRKMLERVGFDATGYPCHEVLHGLEKPCSWCALPRVTAGERLEIEVQSPKDGRRYLVTSAPILHPDSTVSKMTIYRDITHRVNMEKELLVAKKLEATGVIAGGIAHDYNNLLFIILGNLMLLKEGFQKGTDTYRLLEDAESAGQKAAALTKRLLAFTHNESLSFKNIPVLKVVQDVLATDEGQAGFSYHLHVPERPMLARIDAGLISIVIMNIIENAKDAMEGGGDIAITLEDTLIASDSPLVQQKIIEPPGRYICLIISDEGTGIPAEIQKKIFDPYFSTKPRGVKKGVGLGLSTSYSIIKKHGGAITVNSVPDRGTAVSVYLPAAGQSPGSMMIHHAPGSG